MDEKRTLIMDSLGWSYSNEGWESLFLSISSTCGHSLHIGKYLNGNMEKWRSELEQDDIKIVILPIIEELNPRPSYLPLNFPEEFSERLLAWHGNPPVWWIGQFAWYLMRYNSHFKNELKLKSKNLNFTTPCVGIHVRRSDKVGREAEYYDLKYYMKFVDEWYRNEKNPINIKRVYLATDDPTVLIEAGQKYPNYVFFGDINVAKHARYSNRFSETSLHGVVTDIHFLSRCDFLICTFSSHICRLAYELMQVVRGDAATHFHSLDEIYYFGGQESREQIVIESHHAASSLEIDLEIGDKVGIGGIGENGYNRGRNYRTDEVGLYPSSKVKDKWRIVRFPSYNEADRKIEHE